MLSQGKAPPLSPASLKEAISTPMKYLAWCVVLPVRGRAKAGADGAGMIQSVNDPRV